MIDFPIGDAPAMRARAQSMRAEAAVLREADVGAAGPAEIPNNIGASADRVRDAMWDRKMRLYHVADRLDGLAFELERSADGVEQAILDFQVRSQAEWQSGQ